MNPTKNPLLENQQLEKNQVRLFLGGIPAGYHQHTLKKNLAKLGKLFSLKTNSANKSKRKTHTGFGFAVLSHTAKVEELINAGYLKIGKSTVRVELARDKEEESDSSKDETKRKIFVGGLPKNTEDYEITSIFSKFGDVEKAYVVRSSATSKTRGFGFVIFTSVEGADNAIQNDGFEFHGKSINIKKVVSDPNKNKDNSVAVIKHEKIYNLQSGGCDSLDELPMYNNIEHLAGIMPTRSTIPQQLESIKEEIQAYNTNSEPCYSKLEKMYDTSPLVFHKQKGNKSACILDENQASGLVNFSNCAVKGQTPVKTSSTLKKARSCGQPPLQEIIRILRSRSTSLNSLNHKNRVARHMHWPDVHTGNFGSDI